ncbi:MAG: head protein [Micrococcales bacterium]|nr:head protein [Micrococcales bacterium]
MTAPVGTFTVYDTSSTRGGLREDLSDMIYSISPTDTPLMSTLAKSKATAVYHEWQTDSLAAATTANALVEGDDAIATTASPTFRIGNYTQIVGKTIQVSGTLEAVDKAGRKSEKAYQLAKASSEIKRDIETILFANQASTAGSSSSARKMGTMLAWLKTNTSFGTSGADPTTAGSTTRSDGVVRTFTETILKEIIREAYISGGNPKVMYVSPIGKQKTSEFTGIAAQRYMAPGDAPTTIIGAADVYMSDFGSISIVPNRFMRTRDAVVVDPEYAALAYLRPFQTIELAKTGDSEKTQLLAELTLEMRNEAAHGIAADLNFAL